MKDWQFWMLMSSLWFTHPFGKGKGEVMQVVICLLCVLMFLYSIFPWAINNMLHF